MTSLAWLIPTALVLGGLALAALLWSLKSGQYEDLDGAAWRALEDRPPDGEETARKPQQVQSPQTQPADDAADKRPAKGEDH